MIKRTYWFPNSEAVKRKPVLRTHMAAATGTVSKYFMRISVTCAGKSDKYLCCKYSFVKSVNIKIWYCTNHVLINFHCDFKYVTLFCLHQKEKHRLEKKKTTEAIFIINRYHTHYIYTNNILGVPNSLHYLLRNQTRK